MLYTRVSRLFADLTIAHGEARYGRLLRSPVLLVDSLLNFRLPETFVLIMFP